MVPVSSPTPEEIAHVKRRGSERAAAAARRARNSAEAEVPTGDGRCVRMVK